MTSTPELIRPVRPQNPDALAALVRDLDKLIRPQGYRLRTGNGGASWLGRRGSPSEYQTMFKLAVTKAGMLFGIRKELADSASKLKQLPWPRTFMVLPKAETTFVGFRVLDSAEAVQRVGMILEMLREIIRHEVIHAGEQKADQQFAQRLHELGTKGAGKSGTPGSDASAAGT